MADDQRVRVEIAFDGGQVIGIMVDPQVADELEQALAAQKEDAVSLEAEDGRYTVALRRVVYAKRFLRESRVGFATG